MGMPGERQRWTADKVRAMQHESRPWPRYELIDGELLASPAPSWYHQRAVFRLARALDDYVRAYQLGEALMSPADIELEPERITQPDVFVVPDIIDETTIWHAAGAPEPFVLDLRRYFAGVYDEAPDAHD